MKNKCFLTGILVILLVFGMALIGCDNGTTPEPATTPFEGTWVSNQTGGPYTLVFRGTSFTATMDGEVNSGTFTYSRDYLNLPGMGAMEYILEGNTLTFPGLDIPNRFTKQQ